MSLLQRFFGPNIAKLSDNGDVQGLCDVIDSEAKAEHRIAALEAVAAFEHEQARNALVSTLADRDPEVARVAESQLTDLGAAAAETLARALDGEAGGRAKDLLVALGEDGVEPLRAACTANDEAVRTLALDGLLELDRTLGSDEARETVFRTLLAALGDRSPELRRHAAETLGDLRDERAARALAAQLKDGDEGVRDACGAALAALGEPAILHLSDALGDRNNNSRRLAAGMLAEMCTEAVDIPTRAEVLEALVARARDGVPEVRAAVTGALQRVPAEDVVAAKLEQLADPEASGHDEILEILMPMLDHCAIGEARREQLRDRVVSLGFSVDD